MSTQLMMAREVARALAVGDRTVWKLVSAARIPKPVRIGRCVRWRTDDIASWIDAGCPARDRWEALVAQPEGSADR